MEAKEQVTGKIKITDNAVEELVGYMTTQVYGVVGMASPSLKERLLHLLSRDIKKGVQVVSSDDSVSINVYIIVEHGVNIQEVAHNLQEQVTYAVETHAGLKVAGVNVHVKGIKT